MIQATISEIVEYARWRGHVHAMLTEKNATCVASPHLPKKMVAWYNALMALSISKRSTFGEQVWDFNDDEPNASRNVRGARMRLEFNSFPSLSQCAILEVKMAVLVVLRAPAALGLQGQSKKNIKPATIVSCFRAGLGFIETMSVLARKLMGDEFFEVGYHGLAYFDSCMYREAAKKHRLAFGSELMRFFSMVRSKFLQDQLFDSPLPNVVLSSLPWARVQKQVAEADRLIRILPNTIFEKASRQASFAVVDFLETLGESVHDSLALERRNASNFFLGRSRNLSKYNLEIYLTARLRAAGYDSLSMGAILDSVLDKVWPELRNESSSHDFKTRMTLMKMSGFEIGDDFRKYINFVAYSACYIVAQYTGMRPSELAELIVETCLEQEADCWVLISNVIKHRQGLAKLFDDKWVAIPIVRDAIRVGCIIAQIRQNPYLFSNVMTVPPGATPKAMTSNGIAYQFSLFFKEILTEQEFSALDFSPYTLRHTLAFQMARAELGLPFISHQLKHFGDLVGRLGQNKAFSKVTPGYGAIAETLSKGGRSSDKSPTRLADEEYILNFCDPDGSYAGPNALNHKARMKKIFNGYMAAGYSKEEIVAQMAKKRLAIINVGQGFCYGSQREEHDESLPCIGSLRCNPNRCKNAVVTRAHAPRWREIYLENRLALSSGSSSIVEEELRAAIDEAKGVLEYLGEEIEG
ncbi:tyrosine-type recombinase/integrase [Pseudomonas sp. YQ_6]|uniref:tyrosine-type recombinase/integrase n=2 Tax=Pseudomonas TaxID=286 RepID=UPI0025603D1B|nr:tyrosine-type recombinase/integrase [Pseudomonas putida]EKT8864093.1 tyrosine-type recombinase/integrase [Pseudomonas putida]